jgi:hypothetical protein
MNSSGMQMEHYQLHLLLLSLKLKYYRKQTPMDESYKGKIYEIRRSPREEALQPSKSPHPGILPYFDSPGTSPDPSTSP